MYNIIPLILILTSLTVIIAIIVRKFSALASLDVENIPAEKEAKFKERIISSRLKKNIIKWSAKLSRLIKPIGYLISKFFKWLYNKLDELKEDYKNEKVLSDSDAKQKIEKLFGEAEELKKTGDLTGAEKAFIEIIGLDSKNMKAFKALGQFYFERKDFEEAKQTFEHILKVEEDNEEAYDGLAQTGGEKGGLKQSPLDTKSYPTGQAGDDHLKALDINRQRSQTYFDLAMVYQAMNNADKSIANIKQALRIEPNNPRYLDTMLEISIINKDKALALDAYKKLTEVNPDNQKLAEFKRQIDEL